MKLISLITLLGTVHSQNIQREQFSFPPLSQTPSSAFFSSDSSIYLPPESHTPVPYYTLNNVNKSPFQSFPTSGTMPSSIFSTPYPIFFSSTLNSNVENDGIVELNKINNNRRSILMLKPTQNNIHNTSASQAYENRNANTHVTNVQHSPFEKIDNKQSNYASGNKASVQNSAARRMIVTSEIQRTDVGPEQLKTSSFQNSQYVKAPGVFITSTAEPSIPILRLSNEMDLDGSFSYEALGADQTHYVQHSRMENMGTDKEEQVVEGSYSYVGDDGRTYTVHYVADSNGYRATGDHLPVPPPVPEIIQRAVQYNLAEEANKPPHLKSSWENEDNEFENREESRNRIFNIPPPRNLFTGKTPEAFSFGFSQGINSQNNLVTASSYQVPTKSSFDIIMDQSKLKQSATPISPQITFLASQGARNPSQQPQSTPMKTMNTEKSTLPLLMNYEADIKEPEQDANKGLWRWQYGLNANTNQTPSKNSISRSSSEGDDIVINFQEMTPDQYTRMIQSQVFGQNAKESNSVERYNEIQSSTQPNKNIETHKTVNKNNAQQYTGTEKYRSFISTESNNNLYSENTNEQKYTDSYSKIISSRNFIPLNEVAIQSYNVEITKKEPTKINAVEENTTENMRNVNKVEYSNNKYYLSDSTQTEATSPSPFHYKEIEQSELNVYENNGFKPVSYNSVSELPKYETTTNEPSMNDVIKDNIFLRSLFKSENSKENLNQVNIEDKNKQTNITLEAKQDKIPKYIPFEEKPQNEIRTIQSKPLDINDVLNYVIMKNHFESIKTKPKNKLVNNFNQKIKDYSTHYIPVKENNLEYENNKPEQEGDYRNANSQQHQELRGLIKNYKVLQRHKNMAQKSQPMIEPQRHIKAFHTQGLPPLGRAGPSMKSYLPPTYL